MPSKSPTALAKKAAYGKKWYAANPHKRRAAWLKCRYGLSVEQFAEMLIAQGGRCTICQLTLRRPNVDHCHQTGKVRGLLCTRCNVALGNYELLQQLGVERYLRNGGTNQ